MHAAFALPRWVILSHCVHCCLFVRHSLCVLLSSCSLAPLCKPSHCHIPIHCRHSIQVFYARYQPVILSRHVYWCCILSSHHPHHTSLLCDTASGLPHSTVCVLDSIHTIPTCIVCVQRAKVVSVSRALWVAASSIMVVMVLKVSAKASVDDQSYRLERGYLVSVSLRWMTYSFARRLQWVLSPTEVVPSLLLPVDSRHYLPRRFISKYTR